MGDLTLVTGATGFIGTVLTRRLVAGGRPVRVFVRTPGRLHPSVREKVGIVTGDLCDPKRLAKALEGVRTVHHLAAVAKAWSRDPQLFDEVNVAGVERLLEAAEKAAVERLVHVSTILTLPPHRPAPGRSATAGSTPYAATKRAGERLVESWVASGGHAVIVHPSRVYGPGPLNDANAVVKMIDLYLRGRFRVRLADRDVLANYAHVEDVARGMELAEGAPRGRHYVLGGSDNVSLGELLALVDELAGLHRATLRLPRRLALAAGGAAELWGGLGGRAVITRGWVRTFLEDRRLDISPARDELGYSPRSLRRGMAQTLRWLIDRRSTAGSLEPASAP